MSVPVLSPERRAARPRVLTRLGVERLVTHEFIDVAEPHHAHAMSLAIPETFEVEGMKIEAPAGVYHPHAQSSSLIYIRNVVEGPPRALRKIWDLGCGSGAIALALAKRYGADALATDLSPVAIAATRANAARNGLTVRTRQADMFDGIEERDFDLVVFNVPLIDAVAETPWDADTLCDPGGEALGRFAHGVTDYLAPDGLALTGICCNSAYERLEGVKGKLWVVGIDMAGNGFWRAILGLQR